MPREKNIHGGGAQTNINGLRFERETDLIDQLSLVPYLTRDNNDFYYNERRVATILQKYGFYKKFLEPNDIDWKSKLSTKLLPDTAIINYLNNRVYIIEKKYQARGGSVDEKLQTCHYKLGRYQHLLDGSKFDVCFIYLLNDWFKQDNYRDVREYIRQVGCDYYHDFLPLSAIHLDEADVA